MPHTIPHISTVVMVLGMKQPQRTEKRNTLTRHLKSTQLIYE